MTDRPRTQASLGSQWQRVNSDNLKFDNLILAKVIKVYYQYQTVELQSLSGKMRIAQGLGTSGKFSAPYPKEFTGMTPENNPYGHIPVIVPGTLVLVAFVDGNPSNPIIVNSYGYNDLNTKLVRTPMISGDMRDNEQFKFNSSSYTLKPSLTYEYFDGEGNVVKTWNGKSLLSVTSDHNEQESSTDFMYGTLYDDLFTSRYADNSLIEPRIQRAPNMLFKHQGEFDMYGEPDNHITMFYLSSDGTFRRSTLNKEEQFRTTVEQDNKGNYRVQYQADSVIIDEGQDYVEFGIDTEKQEFYVKNLDHSFRFNDDGILVDGKPLLANIDDGINDAFEKLDKLEKSMERINDIIQDLGDRNLRELINATNKAISDVSDLTNALATTNKNVSDNKTKIDNSIIKYDKFMQDIGDYQITNNEIVNSHTTSINKINNTELPSIKLDISNIKNKVKTQYVIGDDSPTSNFTTRFQNILNEIRDNGGGTLYVLPGNYEIKSRIKIYDNTTIIMTNQTKLLRCHNGGFFDNGDPYNNVGGYDGVSNITIIGGILDNNYENIDKYPTKQINMIALRHAKNITIKDLTFRNGITVHCVDMNGSKDVLFDGCRFEGYVNLNNASDKEALQISEYVTGGIDGGIFDGTPCKNITIKNCTFSSSDILGGYNVCIGNHISANNVFNSNIKIYNNTFKDCNIAIRDWKWNDLDIHGNTFINNKECLRASSIGSSYDSAKNIDGTPSNQSQATRNLIFNENKIYNFTSVAIGIYGIQDNDTALIENVKVRDNYIKGSGQGIISSLVKDIVIEGNDIEDTYRAIKYSATKNIRVLNNTISNSKTEAIYGDVSNYGEVHSINYNSIIKHNIIDNTQKNGVFISTGDIINITDNVITNSNMINEENNKRGSIKVDYSDKCIINNNSLYGQTERFAIQATTSTNVISNNNNTNIQE
ncbi:glycerophosphoryl diester phosphodiesterase [Mammaliicoccus phage vB_MscM-PMS3]|nr:glycerophosphoryl diester phosphodiesterase [Mammaliicoccus phage vB_MscM-PMS3]WBF82171.1 glycerophosphoryl diester phosphodiesterase [Mammaliicoccus virus vB_MscM-PMS2]